jgi:hypothetical protein
MVSSKPGMDDSGSAPERQRAYVDLGGFHGTARTDEAVMIWETIKAYTLWTIGVSAMVAAAAATFVAFYTGEWRYLIVTAGVAWLVNKS